MKNVVIAVFACVIFGGSCTLCSANIQPMVHGMPFLALIGFIVSVALGIYSIASMAKRKK